MNGGDTRSLVNLIIGKWRNKMTPREFKTAYGYRDTCSKNCLNCEHHGKKVTHDSAGLCSHIEYYCTMTKPKFVVSAHTICDRWDEKQNKNC